MGNERGFPDPKKKKTDKEDGQQQNVVWESAQNPDGTWKGGVYDHNKGEWEEGYERKGK